MKIECSKEKLQTIVGLVEKVTGKNLSLPILNSIILEAKKRILMVRATNLELGIEIGLPCRVVKDGLVAVSGGVLFNLLSSLMDISVSLEDTAGNLAVSSAQHHAIIKGYPSVDFPTLPQVTDNRQSFRISGQGLAAALREVWYSASVSLIKPEISSVCLYGHGEELAAVATDSFRLAEKIFPPTLKIGSAFPQLIIPIKNIPEIIRVLETISGEVVVEYNQHQISFQAEERYLTSRLVDGTYPDYRQIIPTTQLTEAIVPRAGLLGALKLLNIFVDRLGQITITVSPADKKLKFTASGDHGEDTSTVAATIEGDLVTLAVNVKYLLDCFQSITTDSLRFQLNGPHKPVVIRGVGDSSFTYLIMPINR